MRQATNERPFVTPLRAFRQMFTKMDTGCLGRNRLEFATNFFRSIGFQIETVLLCQATGKKNKDNSFGSASGPRRFGLKSLDIVHSQSEQTDRTDLNGLSARNVRMLKIPSRGHEHAPIAETLATSNELCVSLIYH